MSGVHPFYWVVISVLLYVAIFWMFSYVFAFIGILFAPVAGLVSGFASKRSGNAFWNGALIGAILSACSLLPWIHATFKHFGLRVRRPIIIVGYVWIYFLWTGLSVLLHNLSDWENYKYYERLGIDGSEQIGWIDSTISIMRVSGWISGLCIILCLFLLSTDNTNDVASRDADNTGTYQLPDMRYMWTFVFFTLWSVFSVMPIIVFLETDSFLTATNVAFVVVFSVWIIVAPLWLTGMLVRRLVQHARGCW